MEENFEILNEMSEELRQNILDIEIQIENNLRSIKTADAYLKSVADSEEDDFRLFSPRKIESKDKKRIEEIERERNECKLKNEKLLEKKQILNNYIDRLNSFIDYRKNDDTTKIENLRNSYAAFFKEMEELVQRIKVSSGTIDKNPFQAKQDFVIIAKYLQEIVEKMKMEIGSN